MFGYEDRNKFLTFEDIFDSVCGKYNKFYAKKRVEDEGFWVKYEIEKSINNLFKLNNENNFTLFDINHLIEKKKIIESCIVNVKKIMFENAEKLNIFKSEVENLKNFLDFIEKYPEKLIDLIYLNAESFDETFDEYSGPDFNEVYYKYYLYFIENDISNFDVQNEKLFNKYNLAKEYNESNLNKLIFYKDELEKRINELEANSQRSENKPNPYFQKNKNGIYEQIRVFNSAKIFANALYNIGVKKEDVDKFQNLFIFISKNKKNRKTQNDEKQPVINWNTINDYLSNLTEYNDKYSIREEKHYNKNLIAELNKIFQINGFDFTK